MAARYTLALFHQSIGLAELEPGADDAALFRTGGILDVGGRDKGAVAEKFEIGVAAVGVAGAGQIGGLAVGVVEELDAVFALAAVHDVLEGADPCDIVSVGVACFCHVAESDHEAAIGRVFDDMAIARERGREFFGLAPGACVVGADGKERVMLARVLTKEHDELLPIIGPCHARLRPLARDDENDALLAPSETAIERFALPHDRMRVLGVLWVAAVGPHDESLAAIEGQDALGSHFAHEAEFLHRRPRFAKVRGERAAQIARKVTATEDEEALDALRVGEAMEHRRGLFHKLPVRRRGQRRSPGEPAIIAASERAEVSRVIHAPCREHCPAIRHEHRVAMPLVFLFRAAGDDDLPCRIGRDVHGRDGNRAQGARSRPGKGGHVRRMNEGAAGDCEKAGKGSKRHGNERLWFGREWHVAHAIRIRASTAEVAEACAIRIGRDPKRVELAVGEMKAEAHGFAAEAGER